MEMRELIEGFSGRPRARRGGFAGFPFGADLWAFCGYGEPRVAFEFIPVLTRGEVNLRLGLCCGGDLLLCLTLNFKHCVPVSNFDYWNVSFCS